MTGRSRKLVNLLCMLLICSSSSTEVLGVESEMTLEIDLYRAIVRVRAYDGEEFKFQSSLVDFDRYIDNEPPQQTAGMKLMAAPKLQVISDGPITHVTSPAERELIELVVFAPRDTSLLINIAHYGEIVVSGIEGDIQLKVFKGLVRLGDVQAGLLIDVIRDAEVSVNYVDSNPNKAVVISSYEGSIRFSLPSVVMAAIDAQSHVGSVRNETDLAPDPTAPTFLFRSIKGDIEILRTQQPTFGNGG